MGTRVITKRTSLSLPQSVRMSSLSLNVYTHSGSGPSEEPSSASPTLDPERLRCVTALACDSSGGSVWKSLPERSRCVIELSSPSCHGHSLRPHPLRSIWRRMMMMMRRWGGNAWLVSVGWRTRARRRATPTRGGQSSERMKKSKSSVGRHQRRDDSARDRPNSHLEDVARDAVLVPGDARPRAEVVLDAPSLRELRVRAGELADDD